MKHRKIVKRNPVARELRTDAFRKKIVPLKTKKRSLPRKQKHRYIDDYSGVFVFLVPELTLKV